MLLNSKPRNQNRSSRFISSLNYMIHFEQQKFQIAYKNLNEHGLHKGKIIFTSKYQHKVRSQIKTISELKYLDVGLDVNLKVLNCTEDLYHLLNLSKY